MKDLIRTVMFGLGIALVSTASAVTIINNNKYQVDYKIYDGYSCMVKFNEGILSPAGSVTWESTDLLIPPRICVNVKGKSSILGDYVYNIKNKGCVLTIENAGFMQGINIKKGPGC